MVALRAPPRRRSGPGAIGEAKRPPGRVRDEVRGAQRRRAARPRDPAPRAPRSCCARTSRPAPARRRAASWRAGRGPARRRRRTRPSRRLRPRPAARRSPRGRRACPVTVSPGSSTSCIRARSNVCGAAGRVDRRVDDPERRRRRVLGRVRRVRVERVALVEQRGEQALDAHSSSRTVSSNVCSPRSALRRAERLERLALQADPAAAGVVGVDRAPPDRRPASASAPSSSTARARPAAGRRRRGRARCR